MLLASKGDIGEALTYDQLTEAQKEELKGATGRGLSIMGHFVTLQELQEGVKNPVGGDTYSVGSELPYDIYIYDGHSSVWTNNGPLQGQYGEI